MRRANRWLAAAMLLLSSWCYGGTFINTIGSSSGVAIGGYDVVAFHTEKKAVKGRVELSHRWAEATWYFSSEENRDRFRAEPEKYAPEYGGHCAYGISEGYISAKGHEGQFEIYQGKLYLFPPGSRGGPAGARNAWWQTGGGPGSRIQSAQKNWPKLKSDLEAK